MTIKYRPQALRPGQKSHWYCDLCGQEIMPEDRRTHRCRKGPEIKPAAPPAPPVRKQPEPHTIPQIIPNPALLKPPEPPRCPKCGGAGRRAGGRYLARGARNPRFECTSCTYKYSRPVERLCGNKKWNAAMYQITRECKQKGMCYREIGDVIYERTGVRINRSNIRRDYIKGESEENGHNGY